MFWAHWTLWGYQIRNYIKTTTHATQTLSVVKNNLQVTPPNGKRNHNDVIFICKLKIFLWFSQKYMYVLLYNKTWLELWNRSIASLQCSDVNCGKYSEFTLCTCKCQYLHMYDSVHFCKWISLVELSPYIFFHTQIRYITKESVFYFLFTWQITWKLVPWQMSTLAALSFVTINKTFIKPNILNWCWLLTKKKKKK